MQKFITSTAMLMLFTSIASAQWSAEEYASCFAQARPIFGATMTIENLRQYMTEHADCMTKTVEAARQREEKWEYVKRNPGAFCANFQVRASAGHWCHAAVPEMKNHPH